MSQWEAVAVFCGSLAVLLVASALLTTPLERIGARLRFSEGLLGIVTALGADAPEIASAFAALLSGHHDVGLGVVLGSDIFNLAGLLGLSALVAGRVPIGPQGLWFNGGVSLMVSVVVAVVLRWISVRTSAAMLALVLVPYVALLALRPVRVAHLPLPSSTRRFFSRVGHAHGDSRQWKHVARSMSADALWVLITLALIVLASIGAARSAVLLRDALGMSQAVLGTLVLAALTSIPNVVAAVHLAREGRGAAVLSESLNSNRRNTRNTRNTLNIVAGFCLPALVIGIAAPSPAIIFATLWLLGMILVALGAASHPGGLHRSGGAVLVALHLVFAVAIVLWQ